MLNLNDFVIKLTYSDLELFDILFFFDHVKYGAIFDHTLSFLITWKNKIAIPYKLEQNE